MCVQRQEGLLLQITQVLPVHAFVLKFAAESAASAMQLQHCSCSIARNAAAELSRHSGCQETAVKMQTAEGREFQDIYLLLVHEE